MTDDPLIELGKLKLPRVDTAETASLSGAPVISAGKCKTPEELAAFRSALAQRSYADARRIEEHLLAVARLAANPQPDHDDSYSYSDWQARLKFDADAALAIAGGRVAAPTKFPEILSKMADEHSRQARHLDLTSRMKRTVRDVLSMHAGMQHRSTTDALERFARAIIDEMNLVICGWELFGKTQDHSEKSVRNEVQRLKEYAKGYGGATLAEIIEAFDTALRGGAK